MQEHTINKRRRTLALRFFTYGVMTLATAAISIVCILLVLGYRFDFTKHTVSQGGLIQLQSFPNGAKVTFDKLILPFVTPGKRNVDAGKHTAVFQLDGYREWSKSVTIKAGELRWLNYARLIPQSITTSTVHEFTTVTGNVPTPDRKWMAIYGAADKPELSIADLRNNQEIKVQTVAIPAASFTSVEGHPHQFSLVEWDFSGRYLLVRHTNGPKIEYLRIDRTKPDDVKNVSTQLGVTLSDIHFSGTSGNVFYGVQEGAIRKLDIGAGTISEPVSSGVQSFTLYKTNGLVYVRDKGDKRSVGVSIDGESSEVRSYDTTEPVLTDVTSYFSHNYVAIARGTRVDVIKDPIGNTDNARKTVVTFQVPVGARWLQFSNNGRFVVAGTGTQFVTYDLETNEEFSTNLPGNATDPTKPLQWLDDYYLVATPDKNLRLTEFDGANQNVITDVEPGLPVTLSDDSEALFSIARTTRGYALQSSKMIVEN